MGLLDKFKENLALSIYGMTKSEALKKNICIQCKKSPTFTTEMGRREYPISGLCEPCFDEICKEDE